jgi:hypothetical protein
MKNVEMGIDRNTIKQEIQTIIGSRGKDCFNLGYLPDIVLERFLCTLKGEETKGVFWRLLHDEFRKEFDKLGTEISLNQCVIKTTASDVLDFVPSEALEEQNKRLVSSFYSLDGFLRAMSIVEEALSK